VCGLGAPTAGFMQIDRQGRWAGLAVDICRAVAAAILRDANKVKYVSLAAAQRFPALQAGRHLRRSRDPRRQRQHAKDYAVLGQAISKEPFSPAVRQG